MILVLHEREVGLRGCFLLLRNKITTSMAPYSRSPSQGVEVGTQVWLPGVGFCSGSHRAETKVPPGLCPHQQRGTLAKFTGSSLRSLIHMQRIV